MGITIRISVIVIYQFVIKSPIYKIIFKVMQLLKRMPKAGIYQSSKNLVLS